MTPYHYKIFGLSFESEIEIPGILPVEENPPDIQVRYGHVPDTLENGTVIRKSFQSNKDDFLFNLEKIAKFRVQNGKYITFQPYKEATLEKINIVLLGIIFSGLFIQRGLIPIHGSAVKKGDKSIVFSGKSHAGKSSLALALSKRGYTVIADDLALFDCKDSKNLLLYPGVPFLKLWGDVLDHFQQNENLHTIRPGLDKYIKPLNPYKSQDPVKFERIVFLKQRNKQGFSVKEVIGFDKYKMLMNNSFRIHYLDDQNHIQNYFINLSRLANGTKIYIIERPKSPLQIMELADYVIKTIFET